MHFTILTITRKSNSLRLRVQGTLFLLLLWKYDSLGAPPTEHLPPPLPATCEVDQLYNSVLGLNNSLTAFLFSHLLFLFRVSEIVCPFFTFEIVIYFPKKIYFFFKDHHKKYQCIIFSSLLYPVGYFYDLGAYLYSTPHVPDSTGLLIYQNNGERWQSVKVIQ